jgi:Flp pilus assembly protein TadG
MLVLGAIDWGWYFYTREVVTNAAREGARTGSVSAIGSSDAQTAAKNAATTYLSNLNLTGETVNVTTPDVTVSGTVMHTVRVVVSYPAGSLTGFSLPGFMSLVPSSITATAQMRGEWP